MDDITYLYIQFALLASAWCLFVPIGITFAVHRRLFQAQFIGLRAWFHLHRLFMLLGAGAFYAGVVVFFLFVGNSMGGLGTIGEVYRWLLVAVSGALFVHIAGTLLRPPQTHDKRDIWNVAHRISGIIVWLSGLACVYIGAYTMVVGHGQSYIVMMTPISAVLFVMALVNIGFGFIKCKKDPEEPQNQ